MTRKTRRVLFVAPLPEPVTGQSLACQVFLDDLQRHTTVEVVDMSKKTFRQGVDSVSRITEVLRGVWQVWRSRRGADVIYYNISESVAGNAKDLLTYLACLFQLDRMVVHLHGGAGMRELMRGRLGVLRWLNGFFLRRMRAVIVLGQRHLDVFNGAVPPDRLRVVPNFAADEIFVDESRLAEKFARMQPLQVLYLSNMLPGKGYLELLRAFQSLAPTERELLELHFAGGFESEDDKARFLSEVAPLPQVRYHGTVKGEAKRALFAGAHVFCLPTYYPYEGQPISILEAYASGCAVITTDHSGIFDTFTPGVNGFEVDKRSAVSLAAALRKVLSASAELAGMARHNLATARARYTTRRFNDELLDIVLGHDIPAAAAAAEHRS